MVESITRKQFDEAWDAHRPAAKEYVNTRMVLARDKNAQPVAYTQGQHNAINLTMIDLMTMLFVELDHRKALERRIADLEEQATKP